MPPREIVVLKPVGKIPKKIYTGGTLEPPEFMPSFYEWLHTHSIQIIEHRTKNSVGSLTIYEVPKSHTLFITNSFLNVLVSTVTDIGVGLVGNSLRIDTIAMIHYYSVNPVGNYLENKDYSIPLVLHEGQKVILDHSTTKTTSFGGFKGFLVLNRNIPKF